MRQVCVLYPLETIKVKCQADGISAAAALRVMLAAGPMPGLRALYSGIGAAAVCSVIVGAVHCEQQRGGGGGGRDCNVAGRWCGPLAGVCVPGSAATRAAVAAARR
jgi:hypothetical protein